eukprot:GEMP01025111.1.p1 GENE.GEMP01025111.1~~GEMP01025111.1.p1  ORF type:complete len:334 (+),score=68.01 GEMP01025111.1:155-1156(+)
MPQLIAGVVSSSIVANCHRYPYAQYEITTKIGEERRYCARRYRDFFRFHTHLHSVLPTDHPALLFNFPPKCVLTSLATSTIERRQKDFNDFLQTLVDCPVGRQALGNFIDIPVKPISGLPREHSNIIANAEVTMGSLLGEWKLDRQQDGAVVSSQMTLEGRKAFKTTVKIAAPLELVWETISDCHRRMTWDRTIAQGSTLNTYHGTGHDVVQYITTPLAGGAVSSRHFVMRRKIEHEPGKIKCIIGADSSQSVMTTDPGSVRIESMAMAWEIETVGTDTLFTQILALNPGGNLPAWLVDNTTGKELMKMAQLLREACRNDAKSEAQDMTAVAI